MDLFKSILSHFQTKNIPTKVELTDTMNMELADANISEQKSTVCPHSVYIENTGVSVNSNTYKTKECLTKEYFNLDESENIVKQCHDTIHETKLALFNEPVCINKYSQEINALIEADVRCLDNPSKLTKYNKNIDFNSEILQDSAYKTTISCLKEFDRMLSTVKSKDGVLNENKGNLDLTLDDIGDILGKLDESNKDDPISNTNSTNAHQLHEAVNFNKIYCKTEANTQLNEYLNNKQVVNHNKDEQTKCLIEDSKPFDVIPLNSTEEIMKIPVPKGTDLIETISISSEDTFTDTKDSDCSGYHSSDFEFISENEAELDGLIINYAPKEADSNSVFLKTVEITQDTKFKHTSNPFSPGVAGPSHYEGYEPKIDCYKTKHVVPEGDDYLNLFRGIHNPVLPTSAIYFLENKSIRSSTCMLVEFEGMGFDMRKMAKRDSSDEEFKNEADESVKKILSMYPGENRKRRRRI